MDNLPCPGQANVRTMLCTMRPLVGEIGAVLGNSKTQAFSLQRP